MPVRVISTPRGLSFSVKVVTNASKSEIVGVEGEFLKIRLAAAPVDSKANRELVDFMAKLLSIPKFRVQIRSGFASKRKVIHIENYDKGKFNEFLSRFESA